jgi:hypothetical protein
MCNKVNEEPFPLLLILVAQRKTGEVAAWTSNTGRALNVNCLFNVENGECAQLSEIDKGVAK